MEHIKSFFNDDYNLNVFLNYLFRILTIFLSILSVKLSIQFLGTSLYGLWVTISSIVSWMSSGDFGIGNGLRNELTKAYAKKDSELQIKLVSTSIVSLTKISAVLFGIFIIMCEIFFRCDILSSNLRIPMYITVFFFCINLVIGLVQSIGYAYQKSWLITFMTGLVQFIMVMLLFLLIYLIKLSPNLIVFSILNGCAILFPNIVLYIYLDKTFDVFPTFNFKSNYDKSLRESILKLGGMFFVLQICSVVLYSTDSVIINYFFGSNQVTNYSIITQIYNTGTNLFSILLVNFWSAVTLAIESNNFKWIITKTKQIIIMWIGFSLGVVFVSVFLNLLVKIWLGTNAPYFDFPIVFLFALYTILSTFGSIFVSITNGLSRLKLQLIFSVLGAVINIPLSVFLGSVLGLGIFGVKLATLICCFGAIFVIPVDITLFLKNKGGN